jgi:hypothetical protein
VVVNGWSSEEAGDSAQSGTNELVALVQQRAVSLDSYLQTLVLELAEHVQTVAAKLGLSDSPSEQEFRNLVREMPVFDFAASWRTERPKLSAVLGRGYTERAVRAQLERQVGTVFVRAAVTYAALLQDWAERVLRQIRQRFELYAEGYRAQIERSLAGRQLSPETIEAIQRDLAALESKEREGAVATGRAIS